MMQRVLPFIVVAALVAVALMLKGREGPVDAGGGAGGAQGLEEAASGTGGSSKGEEAPVLPRLIDLGSDTCIPCKKMAPILEELREELAGRVVVEFIDTRKEPERAAPYEIRYIPTQVFLDAGGEEVFRHVGFMAKEDILAKLRETELLREDR